LPPSRSTADAPQRLWTWDSSLATETEQHVKTVLQRQIEATDRQIDLLVYGLTDDEIKLVEAATS